MRSSPQLLQPDWPSSPFVSLPFHFHATHLLCLYYCLSSYTFTSSSLHANVSLFSFPTSSLFHTSTSVTLSLSLFLASTLSPGGPPYPGPPSASSSLPSLAHSQWEAGSLTPSEQQEAAAAGVRPVWRCWLALSEVLPSQG